MAPNLTPVGSLASLASLDLSEHSFVNTSKYQLLVPKELKLSPQLGASTGKFSRNNSLSNLPSVLPPAGWLAKFPVKPAEETKEEQDDYWYTPTEQDGDYFSASYIESKMVEEAAKKPAEKSMKPASVEPSESYWDWSEEREEEPQPKSALIEAIMKSESIRQMLTCENIEEQEAKFHRSSRSALPQVEPTHCNSMHESHSYFYFPSKAESKEIIISRILEEEEQRQTVLTSNIVKNLMKEREEMKVPEVTVSSGSNAGQSYWDW